MNNIPLKAVTYAFSVMPKKSAAHRDGWTWELLRDAAQTPSTAALLTKLAERFILQWSAPGEPMGIFGLGIGVSLPHEIAGRENITHIPCPQTGHSGIGPYSCWMQSDGKDEQDGSGSETTDVAPVLFWNK